MLGFVIFKLAKYVDFYSHMRNQLFLLLCILISTGVKAQEATDYPEAYEVFDFFVGHTNAGVFDGVEYLEKYPVRNNKHKFFDSPNFQLGSLHFADEPYFNVALKYDVYDDILLAKNTAINSASITQLDSKKIRSFTIADFHFVRLNPSSEKDKDFVGFFEVLFDKKELVLLKKHQKKMFKKVDNGVYYEFKDNPWYLMAHKGSYVRIKNENSLIAVFPNSKDYIRSYSQSNSALKEENYDSYLVSLFIGLKK